jgi:hypothetical protein
LSKIKKMKIQKALKLKKKLAGEINKLQSQIRDKNSYAVGTVNLSLYNVQEMLVKLENKTSELINLKMRIYDGNRPIQERIFKIAEIKSQISFLQTVSCLEGEQLSGYGIRDNVVRVYSAQISEADRDNLIELLQNELDSLQEQIDAFNYTTDI